MKDMLITMLIALLAFCVLVVIVGCSATPAPTEPEPAIMSDCEAACVHLRELGCSTGDPTPDGMPCEEGCRIVEASGFSTMYPSCIRYATSCEQADEFSQNGCWIVYSLQRVE